MNPTNFIRETIDLVRSIETRFLELGKRLYKIKSEELWKDSYDSFQEFLDAAKINPGNASILTAIHKAYVVDGHIPQNKLAGIGYSNLYASIPLIERGGVEKAVMVASTLTRDEINQEVREEKYPKCLHSEHIKICTQCKKRIN